MKTKKRRKYSFVIANTVKVGIPVKNKIKWVEKERKWYINLKKVKPDISKKEIKYSLARLNELQQQGLVQKSKGMRLLKDSLYSINRIKTSKIKGKKGVYYRHYDIIEGKQITKKEVHEYIKRSSVKVEVRNIMLKKGLSETKARAWRNQLLKSKGWEFIRKFYGGSP